MELYFKLFEVIFPVFFVIGIGYYLGRKNPNFDTTFITKFTANIGSPGLVIFAVTTTGLRFNTFVEFFAYSLLAVAACGITGAFLLKLLKKDYIRELPPLILPNTGNIGLPICFFAYGNPGLGIASAIFCVIILFHFTIGVLLADKKFSIKPLIKNGPFYAILISMFFLYFDITPPKFVTNTAMLLAYATIVLVLMSLGIGLSKLKVFSFGSAFVLSLHRVLLGPLIGFSIIYFFNLEGFAAGALLIQTAMPSAILTYLVAQMYSPKRVVDSIASTIVVSTTLSFITIPIVVYLALRFFS
tara:strand:- start:680 stop:1579 length:900 start_codon:yes stop_codon:yes gene_type:complete